MKVMKHLDKWWLYYMILAWQWIKILVKKKLKSIYFKFIWFYDFYAPVTKGLKWLTVSITLVGRINLLWKQIVWFQKISIPLPRMVLPIRPPTPWNFRFRGVMYNPPPPRNFLFSFSWPLFAAFRDYRPCTA